ncbi:MAG: phenylalanine--tRNA ligase subunit alpha [Elusimicrobiota bacterium]
MQNNVLNEKLDSLRNQGIEAIKRARDFEELGRIKAVFMGKKSKLKEFLGELGKMDENSRRIFGQRANSIRDEFLSLIEIREKDVLKTADSQHASVFDPQLPGQELWVGHTHILTQVTEEIVEIFKLQGFDVAYGPEVEDDYHNFEALNHPKDHPARDMQDTFYISEDILLRTHTSPVQIRIMEKASPPLRFIASGRVYRNEEISSRSYCLFHQVEGLYVDRDVSFAHLKASLLNFVHEFFGSQVGVRLRPSFFPFTEPSAELDIACIFCGGKGCPLCKKTGWIEILGCGMVNPKVFKFVNIDPEIYSGFAFGMGVERMAQIKYGINDIRVYYENDKRFLEQF